MILALRTDRPEATVSLLGADGLMVSDYSWLAHRSLARDVLKVIEQQLQAAGSDWQALSGLVYFSGPGSFTGLRIGAAVMNTLAHVGSIPIVAVGGESWRQNGLERLRRGEDDRLAMPQYGAEAHITQPKK